MWQNSIHCRLLSAYYLLMQSIWKDINDASYSSRILKYSSPTSHSHLFNLVQTKSKPHDALRELDFPVTSLNCMNQALPENR